MRWLLLIVLVVLLWLAVQGSQSSDASSVESPEAIEPDGTDLSNYGSPGSLAAAWARAENTQNRYNNPVGLHGNWAGVTGHTPSGEAIFDNLSDAWTAVNQYINQQATAHPGWSLNNFFGKVLGNLQGQPVDNEQGNSNTEAATVAGFLGVDPGTLLASYAG